jgi:hypothetical protein
MWTGIGTTAVNFCSHKRQAVLKTWEMRGKVKVKLSLCLAKHHAMKTCWGSGYIAPRIFYLGTRWRWVVSFTPRPLSPQGKSPWCPLDRRLSGFQRRSGRGGEEKNSQPPLEIELYIVQPIAQRYAELSRLWEMRGELGIRIHLIRLWVVPTLHFVKAHI